VMTPGIFHRTPADGELQACVLNFHHPHIINHPPTTKYYTTRKCTILCDGVTYQKTADGWHLGRELTCSLHLSAAALCVASREGIKSASLLVLGFRSTNLAYLDSLISACNVLSLTMFVMKR
jgi:hypothetical protein